MPGGDRTGPMGVGAMTGRRAGLCVGADMPGYMNYGYGRGCGRGNMRGLRSGGGGRGLGMGVQVGDGQISMAQEKNVLETHLKLLREEVDMAQKRLSKLEREGS